MFDELNDLYKEVEAQSFEDLVPGLYFGNVTAVKFKGDNKWKDGTVVPQVSIQLKVSEGDYKGATQFINLNLGGRTPDNIRISLSVFKTTMARFGIKEDSLEDVLDSLEEVIGREVSFEVSKSGDFTNASIKKVF